MNTIIISNVHREPLGTKYFQYLDPIRSLTPDYPFPMIGHQRCFAGHTNAIKTYMTHETALIIEDDCIPDLSCNWTGAIEAANKLALNGWEFVCLHGRGFNWDTLTEFTEHGFRWLKPINNDHWVLGTLIYVINREGAKKFCSGDFWNDTVNIDLFVWSSRHKWCMLDPFQFETRQSMIGRNMTNVAENPKPFIHDRSTGSLIENPKNTQYVYR